MTKHAVIRCVVQIITLYRLLVSGDLKEDYFRNMPDSTTVD